ncbi:MAG: ATPase, T2SS/T4P/T4SS family [bacterium]
MPVEENKIPKQTAKQQKLLDFLVQKNLVKAEDANKITTELMGSRKDLERVVVNSGMIESEKFVEAKAEFMNLPYANLYDAKVEEDILNSIPSEVADNYKVVCFKKEGNRLSIGITNPDDFKAIEAIDFFSTKNNFKVEYYLISDASFKNVFKQYKQFSKEISSALKTKAAEDKEEREEFKKDDNETENFDEIVKNAPVAKIVSTIIKHAVEDGASDIHIEPMAEEVRVRFRIDGILQSYLTLPKNVHESVVARIKVLAKLKLDETRVPQDGRIRLSVNKNNVDFRVSVLPLMGEEKVVLRVLDTSKGVLKLEELGFIGNNLDIINKNIKKTGGILLVCGPTGSGKTTTLYSVLHIVNQEGVNIVTLEDPVEYFIEGVNQSQIRPKIGFSFATGLRSLLRQDPDIMMVGEIRDNETAELAIHAALTGHLVLSTLHTNSAIGAIPRLLDMKIESFLLASVMEMVVAQRLTRKLCPHCKREKKLEGEPLNEVKEKIAKIPETVMQRLLPKFDINNINIFEKVGCPRCNKTGYKGRIAIAEALDSTEFVKDSILNKRGVLTRDDLVKDQTFTTMEQDGLIKALQGQTSLEEVLRVIKT